PEGNYTVVQAVDGSSWYKASAHVPEWRKKKQEAAVSMAAPPEKPKTTRASPRKTPKKKAASGEAETPMQTPVSPPAPVPSPSVPPTAPDTADGKRELPAEMEIVTVDKDSIMS
ncbi:MAG: hypothetical protein NC121_19845, partial [Blautia sp.]|nr:hypothetical protein [Blautia sp.]